MEDFLMENTVEAKLQKEDLRVKVLHEIANDWNIEAKQESTDLLAPGTHSHFESGKFSQFWPEPGTNPAQWVRLKTPFRVHPKQPN